MYYRINLNKNKNNKFLLISKAKLIVFYDYIHKYIKYI